jgi:uncharacterized spore protein YtfJ
MIPTHGMVFGDPVTAWGKTIVPVVRIVRFGGERCGMISASPVAVLIIEGDCCWFAPLSGQFKEAELQEALISRMDRTHPG